MSVRKRWINFLYNISTGTKKVRNLLTPVGVIIFGVFIFVFVLASIYLDNILNLPKLSLNAWNMHKSRLWKVPSLFSELGLDLYKNRI